MSNHEIPKETLAEALAEADKAREFDDSRLRDSSRALIVLADEVKRLRESIEPEPAAETREIIG